jgi:hypothetical protein
MRVKRGFLYWGIFLVAVGGVLVAADLRAVDTSTLADALRLWPLAVIAIGLSLALRRTRLTLPALLLAAAVPGLVVGAAFAVAPRFVGDCGAQGDAAGVVRQGSFDGAATVAVRSGCGTLRVTTVPGNGWQLDANNTAGRPPTVESSARSLSIDTSGDEHWNLVDGGRGTWDLTLPTSDIDDLSLVVLAGNGEIGLPGARIKRLALTANAAEMVVDASSASIASLSAVVNVGSLSLRLPAASDLVGSLRVGGGELQVCAPPGVGLRITTKGGPKEVTVDGLHEAVSEWQSPDYASATYHADLSLTSNFAAVVINPIGGCK